MAEQIRIEWGIRWLSDDEHDPIEVEIESCADEDAARFIHATHPRQTVVVARAWTPSEWREMTE